MGRLESLLSLKDAAVSLFLTLEEMAELTGYKRSSLQAAWLKRTGIPHYVAASGRPIVVRDALLPPHLRRNELNEEGDRLLETLRAKVMAQRSTLARR